MTSPWRSDRRAALVVSTVLAVGAMGCGCGGPIPPHPSAALASASVHGSAGPSSPTLGASPPESFASPAPRSDGPGAGSLLLLEGRPGAMRLEVLEVRGDRRAMTLPDPDVAWISTDRSGRVLATTRGGRAFRSTAITPGQDPTWTELLPRGIDRASLAGPLAFGTLTPEGARAAFIAADPTGAGPFQIVIVGTASDDATVVRVPSPPDGAPPSWIDGRIAVLTRERGDIPGVAVVDPRDGRVTPGPGPDSAPVPGGSGRVDAVAIAADGSTVAFASAVDGPIQVAPARSWLAGGGTAAADVPLDAEPAERRTHTWLALDPSGDRLAVVRTDADGDAVAVSVHRAERDWVQIGWIELSPGADRAAVAWLP